MNQFNDLDKHFDQLKRIERSKAVKAQTLADILQTENSSKRNRLRNQRFIVAGTTLLSAIVAILLLFLYTGDVGDSQTATGLDIEISKVLIAESKSAESFEATSIASSMNTIEIADDRTFYNQVEQFLKGMEHVATPPAFNLPAYDMAVRVEDGNPYKMKIWKSGENIYVHHIDEDQYYVSSDNSAFNVFNMMNNIPFPE